MVEMSAPLATALPPSFVDGVDDLLRHREIGAGAVARAAEIVDHDGCAFAREQFCVGFTEAATGASDDGNLAVEKTHDVLPVFL